MTEGDDGRSAVRLIAINKTLRAEAERLLPTLDLIKAPATEEDILGILVRHAPHYGITSKVAGEWGAFFGAYLDALSGLSAYAIEDAFVRWNRGEGHEDIRMAGFYPKAPQLYLLATTARNELATATYRAKRALEYVEEKGVDWTDARKREEREKAKKLGFLNDDGTFNLPKPKGMHQLVQRPTISPQQMAQRILAAADRRPLDDVGDVI